MQVAMLERFWNPSGSYSMILLPEGKHTHAFVKVKFFLYGMLNFLSIFNQWAISLIVVEFYLKLGKQN